MKNLIDEIIFKMQDGREVCISEYSGGWTQYGVTRREMFSPRFVQELWRLLLEWQMVERY